MSIEAAYHEAGHAVLARKSLHHEVVKEIRLGAYKSGCTSISLSRKKLTRAGKSPDELARLDPEVAVGFAVILCGGLVAEEIANQKGINISPSASSAAPDHAAARIELVDAGLADDLKPYEAIARELLNLHWVDVVALAQVLVKDGSCHPADVHLLVPA